MSSLASETGLLLNNSGTENFANGTTRNFKDFSACFLSVLAYSVFNLTTPHRVANFYDKQPFGEVTKFSEDGKVINWLTGKHIQH